MFGLASKIIIISANDLEASRDLSVPFNASSAANITFCHIGWVGIEFDNWTLCCLIHSPIISPNSEFFSFLQRLFFFLFLLVSSSVALYLRLIFCLTACDLQIFLCIKMCTTYAKYVINPLLFSLHLAHLLERA